MKRATPHFNVMIVCLAVTGITWVIHAAESQNQLRRKAQAVRPRIRTVQPVNARSKIISGQFRKGLPQKTQMQIPSQLKGRSGRTKIPKARKQTVADSLSILKKIKGTGSVLAAAPVPTSADSDAGMSALLTPNTPSGTIKGVRNLRLTLFGVILRANSTSLQDCVRINNVDIIGAGLDRGRVHVGLNGAEPGWYIVGAEFSTRIRQDSMDLAARYSLSHFEGNTSVGDDGGYMQVTYEKSQGDSLYMPVLFQITKPNSRANIWFCLPDEENFWFIGATAQRLD
jgi:hypothetical protein